MAKKPVLSSKSDLHLKSAHCEIIGLKTKESQHSLGLKWINCCKYITVDNYLY